MRSFRLLAFLLGAVSLAHAAEPMTFELHVVAEQTGPTTQTYAELTKTGGLPQPVILEKEILLDGTALRSAAVSQDQDHQPVIAIKLTDSGARQFAELSTRYKGRQLGIVVGGRLLSALRIIDTIRGGEVQISGHFTTEEAERLASGLNAAAIKAVH